MILDTPFKLDTHFNDILNQLERSNDHHYITGKAGTGKSTLLNIFRKTSKKQIVVLAPTGVAALNVKGQTIHSFFGFPPKLMDPTEIRKRRRRKLYQKIQTLIIDEISMVRADIFDHIDLFLRKNREDNRPFGGVQVIIFGDLFQLPPVVATPFEKNYFKEKYETPYFFSAKVFQQGFVLRIIEMTRIFRQEERAFIRLLDTIRNNLADYDDLEYLNTRYQQPLMSEKLYITLSARNWKVNQINKQELAKIERPAFQYPATIHGQFDPKLYPADLILNLKVGAQVMLLKNDPGKKYVNGTLGEIALLDNDQIGVSIRNSDGNKELIGIEKSSWEIVKYTLSGEDNPVITTETIGVFIQYPIKLAWAITIHKSQGKTFEHVIIDLDQGAFAHGQTYVALSRCTTMEGIILPQRIRPQDIIVDPRIIEFHDQYLR